MSKQVIIRYKYGELSAVIAESFYQRARGLLGRNPEDVTFCLLFIDCKSVHTYCMKENIDLIFFNKKLQVIKSFTDIKPRQVFICRQAYGALERFSKQEFWPKEGDNLDFQYRVI